MSDEITPAAALKKKTNPLGVPKGKSYTVFYPQQYGMTDDGRPAGHYKTKDGGVEFRGEKLPREGYVIPANSNAYKEITSINEEELPEKVAKFFAKISMEKNKGVKSQLLESYEGDYLAKMASLNDEGKYPATRENAERSLWKLPLKGGPQNPSRKSMIINRLKKK